MKALMSQRAKDVLADPLAKGQLRAFLAARSARPVPVDPSPSAAPATPAPATVIELRSAGRTLRLLPRVVPSSSS